MRQRGPGRRPWLILAFGLMVLGSSSNVSVGQDAPRAEAEGDRERLVMERFLTLLEKAPRRGTALDRVYGYHVERGTLDDLIKRYQDRTAADPRDGVAWLLLGLLEAQRGQDAAAVAALRRAETERPDDALPAFYLGQALVLVGQPDAAAAAFERALTRKPARADLLEIYQALGRVFQRAHRNEQAIEVWTRLEKLFPDDARVQEQIAATLAEESQHEQALVRYQALARSARDPYRKVLFRIEAAGLELRLGRSAAALGDFEALLSGLEPGSWLEREVRRRIEDVFLQNDDQTGLAHYYEKWLEKTPDDVEAMARLGRSLAAAGRTADARRWFDKALKLAPSRKELRLALIEQLGHEKKFAEAAAQYEILSQADPTNPDLVRDWGRLLLKDTSVPEAERKARAAVVWRRLVAARPRDPAIATQVADLLRQADATDEAIALYRKAVELAPDAPQYREYLGEYYHTLKRRDDALAAWRPIAEGANRNAKNLARLAEVLAGFGYKDEAIAAAGEACTLDPEALAMRLKHADLLQAAERFDAAGGELAVAARLAADDDEREAVLERQIKNEQAAGKLAERVAALRTEIDTAGEADRGRAAAAWRRLARYLEVDQKLAEAVVAIERALALDDRSVPGWASAARLYEATGRLGDAAAVDRRLAGLDRRARTDYLTKVARLEARLGRREEALKAGRELLAAAPGNPEHAQFFADLCFQLGAGEEGLETLRRSARANTGDPQALLGLADALAREFRTEEAIELYWRAFDRTNDLDGKLGLIARLTELYLQRNQFDRLVARLERLRQEADRPREPALCLAQAYASSGDLGTARQEVESLLAASPRDTALLQQASSLAESEGNLADAAKYQKQLNDVAPSDESATRLAQLYLRSGEVSEAEALWSRLGEQDDTLRILQATDSLLDHAKYDTVLEITERLIRKDPGNWEALYRQGRALSALDRHADAAQRYDTLLALRVSDDTEGTISRARRKQPTGVRVAGTPAGRVPVTVERIPARLHVVAAGRIRMMLGLQPGTISSRLGTWVPDDFGEARMAALGALFSQAQRHGTQDDWLAARRAARDQAPNDPRPARDFYYVQLLRHDQPAVYEAAHALARQTPDDPAALWAFLTALPSRTLVSGPLGVTRPTPDVVDQTPPLSAAELDDVLAGYRTLRARNPVWTHLVVAYVMAELKRGGRAEQSDALYREEVASAVDAASIASAAALAAERGDVEQLLALFDAYERLDRSRPARTAPQGYVFTAAGYVVSSPVASMAQAMHLRADARAHGDILRLLDRYIASLRDPALAAQRARSRTTPSPSGSIRPLGTQVQVWLNKNSTYTQLDYPAADAYLDLAAIQLLRNAFELYRRDDLLSDLLAHARKPIDAGAPANEQLTAHLMLSALRWWSDDQAAALKELDAAAALAPGDAELRLKLAELRAQQQQPDEALAQLDAVEPLDQATLERRELLALRLSVQAGDLERARQAAERLFGLRLDAATQIQLASQMHQLGMHELAEAVLARARRRTGGNSSTLTSLMRQYQAQGKLDVAVQIALQIVRRGPNAPAQAGTVSTINGEDMAHREAVQVLARSGKLDELIERTEAQIKLAPQSLQLYQLLTTYYRAANKKDKVKDTIERTARLRPDDARLKYQLAQQLYQAGDFATAIDYYRAALEKEPALFGNRFYEVLNAYSRANRTAELVPLLDKIDLKSLGNSSTVLNVINQLSANSRSNLNDIRGNATSPVMVLFRKAWQAYPTEHARMLGQLYQDEFWKSPELLNFAREALIPGPAQGSVPAWQGFDQIMSWGADGRVVSLVGRVLEAATIQKRLDELAEETERALGRHPEWAGGRALLSLVRVRQRQIDKARVGLEELKADKKFPLTMEACWIIGPELESDNDLRPLAVAFYEFAFKGMGANQSRYRGLDFRFSPARRLVDLYQRDGRGEEARELLLGALRIRNDSSINYPAGYLAYKRVNDLTFVAAELLKAGYPADAVRLYNELLGAGEDIEAAQRYIGNSNRMVQQAEQGLRNALHGLNAKTLAATLKTLLKPRADHPEEVLDLVLLVNPRELNTAAVTSLFETALSSAADQPELLKEVQSSVADLVKQYPDDLSVQTAAAILASIGKDDAPRAEAAGRLEHLVEARQLEPISEGARPNARQRIEAARQIPLWIVARACMKLEATRAQGDRLAARALEAARRQTDPIWELAIEGELGRAALKRDDRAAAEGHWSTMLARILTPPAPSRAASPSPARAPIPVPAPAPTGAYPTRRPKPRPAPARPVRPRTNVPVLTTTRCGEAMQVAVLAAENGMHGLSLRAVREALKGGPPVLPISSQPSAATTRLIISGREEAPDPGVQLVMTYVATLDPVWERQKAPAIEVYEALREVVLPTARPTEIFLYTAPLSAALSTPMPGVAARVMTAIRGPSSVGGRLARWAVRAGQADDLRRRVEERKANPGAQPAADVLLGQLATAEGKPAAVKTALDAIAMRLQKDSLPATAELACHAALPAFQDVDLAPLAVPILKAAAARRLSTQPSQVEGWAATLLVTVGRFELEHGDAAGGRATFRDYLSAVDQTQARSTNQYLAFRRKQAHAEVAAEYLRAGHWSDALEALGPYADTPDTGFGDASLYSVVALLVRQLSAQPAAERYARLKDWTMPVASRKSIRLLASFVPTDTPPEVFGAAPLPLHCTDGFFSSADLLIDAARAAGRLDELADLVRPLAESKLENARALFILVELARGRAASVEALVREVAAGLREKWPPPEPPAGTVRTATEPHPIDWADLQVARACLKDRALDGLGEAMIRDLITHARRLRNVVFEAFLYRDLAAVQAARGGAAELASSPGAVDGLAVWHAGGAFEGGNLSQGATAPWWLAHEDHVKCVTGPEGNLLRFDYPLAGSFTFSVDALNGGWTEGHLSYGGLIFEAMAPPQISMGRVVPVGSRSPFLPRVSPFIRRGGFNRLTLEVARGKVRCLVNGHLYYETDQLAATNPWLALYAGRASQPVFRNATLTGHPEIPREVPLVEADRLDGWRADRYAETGLPNDKFLSGQPESEMLKAQAATARQSASSDEGRPATDWSAGDGVILGRRSAPDVSSDRRAGDEPIQSVLTYDRPLRDGELVAYEFLYEPDRAEVHPALGRLAFLLEPAGVRLHWMTTGDTDASGLRPDNAADEPACRRGPQPLPLKPGAWNAARLALDDGTLTLELNGVLIYKRRVDAASDRRFGLYHDKGRAEARVRAVMLRGDWPESLSAGQLTHLLAPEVANPTLAERRVRHELIGEELLTGQAGPLLNALRGLPPTERYQALANWVLPAGERASLRFQGSFEPAADRLGSTLRAPVLELVAAARQLGKLDELADRVETIGRDTDHDGRNLVALRALIAMAREEPEQAGSPLRVLTKLAGGLKPDLPVWQRWPELVVAEAAVERPELRASALALLSVLIKQEARGVGEEWLAQIRAARTLGEAANLPDSGSGHLGGWMPVTHSTAQAMGDGYPRPHWSAQGGELKHRTGHWADCLYLNVPLRGEFEVSAELSSFGPRAAQLVWGGQRPDLKGPGPARDIKFPAGQPVRWYPYRLVVKDRTATAYAGDRKVQETRLPDEPDPWLALVVFGLDNGGARRIEIKGNPSVPEQLSLAAGPDLTGWIADYYDEPLEGVNRAWEKRGDEIVGHAYQPPPRTPPGFDGPVPQGAVTESSPVFGIPGSNTESLLQYHRPMLEDGTMSCEFYYEPGKALVHPALGRIVLLLDPEAVKVHWLTAGKYDRTGLDPGNATIEPDHRRGAGRLPLKPREWNRLELVLAGAGTLVTLRLNGAVVYERPLEPSSDRTFGLFHYADATEVRVKNVVYRGEWPRRLPGPSALTAVAKENSPR